MTAVKNIAIPEISNLKKIGSVLVTRGFGSLLRFLLNILLGSILGTEGVGVYYLYISWYRVLGMVDSLGLPPFALRHVSILHADNKKQSIRWFILKSIVLVSFAGIASWALIQFLKPVLLNYSDKISNLYSVVNFAVAGGILFAIITILAKSIIAQGKANTGINLNNNILPILLIVLLLVVSILNRTISSRTVIIANNIAFLLIAFLGTILAIPALSDHPRQITEQPNRLRSVFNYKNLGSFWWNGVLQVTFTNLPFLMLPVFSTTHQIGLFGAALRFVFLAVTILDALSSIYAPRFAVYFASKKYKLLSRSLRNSQIISLIVYVPFIIVFIFFGESLLGLMGSEFKEAKTLLWIMAVGQLVNSATGLSGVLLNMINKEKQVLISNIINLGVMLLFVSILGYLYGIIGIAIGYSIAISFRFLSLYLLAKTNLKFLMNPINQLD